MSADVLDRPARRERVLSERERRRIALERQLESAIQRSNESAEAAFLIELGKGEKAPTMRLAFNRVRDRLGAANVNLFARNGVLIIAKRPQSRGRRRAS